MTEIEMRNLKVKTPATIQELTKFIEEITTQEHDYGTCVYAMSLSAVAAFKYAASQLGVTGFQASCADLDVIRRTRSLDCPFIILKAEDLLYPQYDLRRTLEDFIQQQTKWCKEQAELRLKEPNKACEEVENHWRLLAETKV
jgi:hypothetical protein